MAVSRFPSHLSQIFSAKLRQLCKLCKYEYGDFSRCGQQTIDYGRQFQAKAEFRSFSSTIAFQPLPLYKGNGDKSEMSTASYFCSLPSECHKRLYYSIQVKLQATNTLITIFQQKDYILAV